jgi:flavin prenyltransferase
MATNRKNICVAITGASGAVYALRLIEVLRALGHSVHLSISPSGVEVIRQETGLAIDLEHFRAADLMLDAGAESADSEAQRLQEKTGIGNIESDVLLAREGAIGQLCYHHYQDFCAPIASGSFLTGGMVICPCSGTTLSAVAHSVAGNLIQRTAEVHLKERRPLVVVPRETPVSLGHLDNMRWITQAGGVVLPASPGWYHGVDTLQDLIDFIVGRICDQLGVENSLIRRWGSESSGGLNTKHEIRNPKQI